MIPLEDFFRNPEKAAFSLSPDGEYLAFMMPWKNRMNVHVQKIGSDKITRTTDAAERDIAEYFWASNNIIVYVKDKGGDENFRLYAINKDGGTIKDLTPFEKVKVEIIDILKNNEKEIIVAMNRRDPRIFDVYRLNIITGKMDMIAENPGTITGWLSAILGSDKKKTVTGVTSTTEERNLLQLELQKKLPGYEVTISSTNRNEDKVLVRTNSDKSRGACYFYNVSTNEFLKLYDTSPWLNETNLADQEPIEYTSRDGLTIKGYLTLPKGMPAKNLPVVVDPHGGPWYRDTWGFDPTVQFFVNRGYAVLQINFRGSVGYGKMFWEKGFKEWGKKMQDDVTDGVTWLIGRGIADPKRVGILGHSYGGYVVLSGLAFTPDLYACGVDFSGISNLLTLLNSIPPYWKPYLEMFYEMIGNPEKDKELLQSSSPFFHVADIKAPLLIAQGANDPRVSKAETDRMVEALTESGLDVTYMVKDNEGHIFYNEENRFDFFRATEKFLGKYLGGRVEKGN